MFSFDMDQTQLPHWGDTLLLLLAGMLSSMLITLGAVYLGQTNTCVAICGNHTSVEFESVSDNRLLGSILLLSGIFLLLVFLAFYRMFKLERRQSEL